MFKASIFILATGLIMRIFALSAMLLVTLTGCKTFWNPTFMPSGYAHHQGVFKSPPGPEARDIGYDYTHEKNMDIVDQWRVATADLVQRAKNDDALPLGAIYLTSNMPASANRSTYDFALREQLNAHGYSLANTADEGTSLFYTINKGEDATQLVLRTLTAKGKTLREVSSMDDIPLVGSSKLSASAFTSPQNCEGYEMPDGYHNQ